MDAPSPEGEEEQEGNNHAAQVSVPEIDFAGAAASKTGKVEKSRPAQGKVRSPSTAQIEPEFHPTSPPAVLQELQSAVGAKKPVEPAQAVAAELPVTQAAATDTAPPPSNPTFDVAIATVGPDAGQGNATADIPADGNARERSIETVAAPTPQPVPETKSVESHLSARPEPPSNGDVADTRSPATQVAVTTPAPQTEATTRAPEATGPPHVVEPARAAAMAPPTDPLPVPQFGQSTVRAGSAAPLSAAAVETQKHPVGDAVALSRASPHSPAPKTLADSLPSPAFGHALAVARKRSIPVAHRPATPTASAHEHAAATPTAHMTAQAAPVLPAMAAGAALAIPQFAASSAMNAAAAGRPGDFDADNELILQIDTANHEMLDTIIGYSQRDGTWLPLGALARFLDLAINISDDGHYASGWALDPAHTLSLNLREGKLAIDGKERPLLDNYARAFEGEMYLKSESFTDLFPAELAVNLRSQTVLVKTRAPFPFEQRLAREAARERLGGGDAGQSAQRFPRERTPWKALDFPMLENEVRFAADKVEGTRVEDDVRMNGDFAFMTARLFAGMSSRYGLTAANVELGRRDPYAQLLGPLRATEFQFGDVSSSAMAMGLGTANGRGGFISNAPLQRASVFDTIDLDGDLADGYEVELYRNNLLIDSTRTPINGQYRFQRVPLEFGLNLFRLVFYGPQGQRREVVRQVSVGDGRLSPGQFVYSASVLQKGVNLFDVHSPTFQPDLDYGAWRASAQVQYGISRNLTASLGGARFQSRGGWHWLVTGGVRTGLAGLAVKADFGLADHGGKAVELGLAGKLGGFSFTLTHAEYRGEFANEVRSANADLLRRATELTFNGSLRIGGGEHPLRIPMFGSAKMLVMADGRQEQSFNLRQALPLVSRFALSNQLEFNRSVGTAGDSSTRLAGTFDLSTISGSKMQYRAELSYGILPHPKLVGVSLEADRMMGDAGLLRLSAGHAFEGNRTSFGAAILHRFGKFSLSLDGNYSTNPGQYSAVLRLGMSLGRNPLSGSLFMAPPGMATSGAVAIRAYRDLNGDERYDKGDTVIPDVSFFTGGEHATTDARGIAFLGRLGDGTRSTVQVDTDSLPDIAFAPVRKGIELVPRAGRIHATDFAIEATAEVDGTAYFSEDGRDRPVSGMRLQLVDDKGQVVARSRSGSDGAFWFEQVRHGTYSIVLDRDQAQALKIHMAGECKLTIGTDGAGAKVGVKVAND